MSVDGASVCDIYLQKNILRYDLPLVFQPKHRIALNVCFGERGERFGSFEFLFTVYCKS